jgi:hypothetical protein
MSRIKTGPFSCTGVYTRRGKEKQPVMSGPITVGEISNGNGKTCDFLRGGVCNLGLLAVRNGRRGKKVFVFEGHQTTIAKTADPDSVLGADCDVNSVRPSSAVPSSWIIRE